MQIIFQCPACERRAEIRPRPQQAPIDCPHCDWQRDEGALDFDGNYVCRCRICGCDDLWRQKDFPPSLGLLFVGLGIVLSSIAWAWHRPVSAIGVLMGFALIDLILYTFMSDMLVCYRCRARHRRTPLQEQHSGFDLEASERYIQIKKRHGHIPPKDQRLPK